MKHILFTLSFFCLVISSFSQAQQNGQAFYHYIFPAFAQGVVQQKSGEINKALLNYNALTEEMIFDQSGQKMALDKTEMIDTVTIENRKFIPEGKVFYELAVNAPVALFIQHKADLISPGNNTGFGTSQTSAITNAADLKTSGGAYQLKLPDDYNLVSKTTFWLRKNNHYYIVKTIKNIQDFFPAKADVIKNYVKVNKTDFKNADDLIKLILFCN